MMAQANDNRLLSLDLVRAILAIQVAAGHIDGYSYFQRLSGGPLCVVYFFVLSGFVLSHAYESSISLKSFRLRDFALARFARLYPLHIVTFVVAAIIWSGALFAQHYAGIRMNTGFNCTFTDFFESITLTTYLFGGKPCFNAPSWSISVEWWCGLGLFALMLPTSRIIKAATCIFVVLIACILDTHYKVGMISIIAGWLAHMASICLPRIGRGWAFAGLTLALLLSIMTGPIGDRLIPLPWDVPVTVVAFAVSVWLCAHLELPSIIAKPSRILGDWSYGIYLWHYPIFLVQLGLVLIADQKFHLGIAKTPIFDLVFFGTVFLTASISFKFLERPMQKLIRSRGTSRLRGAVAQST
jgi:peptidoglycan/LPS O-acetylase OafA/YrhL